jgi:hypothetical protein
MKMLIAVDGSPASLDAAALAGKLINPAVDDVAIYFSPAEVSRRMPWGPQLVEGATAALLLVRRPAGLPGWLPWVAAALLLGIWASTFLVQVPCHQRLAAGWDEAVHARLVATNWLRTGLWTARLLLAGVMAAAVAIERGNRG